MINLKPINQLTIEDLGRPSDEGKSRGSLILPKYKTAAKYEELKEVTGIVYTGMLGRRAEQVLKEGRIDQDLIYVTEDPEIARNYAGVGDKYGEGLVVPIDSRVLRYGIVP